MQKKFKAGFAVMISLAACIIMAQKPVITQEMKPAITKEVKPAANTLIKPEVKKTKVMWLNHLDLLPGDPSVKTSFAALQSLTGGLSGLNIKSTTTGDTGIPGGNKVVEMGVPTIPGYTIVGVKVCYELSSPKSHITQIRLSQLQNPPSTALVMLDDGTAHTNKGPVCVTSTPTSIDPQKGAVRLSLRLDIGNTADVIVIRGVGLILKPTS